MPSYAGESASSKNEQVAVVLEGAMGVGYAAVKGIMKRQPDWTVYLTSRDVNHGEAAVKRLQTELSLTPRYQHLDMDSFESIWQFRELIHKQHKHGISLLVVNSGIMPNIFEDIIGIEKFEFERKSFEETIKKNYFSILTVCLELFPILAEEAKVIFVSSRFAQLAFMNSTPEKQQELKQSSRFEDVSDFEESLLSSDSAALYAPGKGGWLAEPPEKMLLPKYRLGAIYPFGMAKMGINLLAQIFQRQFNEDKLYKNVQVNAVCTGLNNTAEDGADSIVWLALQPKDCVIRGQFIADRKICDPFTIEPGQAPFT